MPFPPKHITTNANANFLGSFRSKGSVSGVYEYSSNGKKMSFPNIINIKQVIQQAEEDI